MSKYVMPRLHKNEYNEVKVWALLLKKKAPQLIQARKEILAGPLLSSSLGKPSGKEGLGGAFPWGTQ